VSVLVVAVWIDLYYWLGELPKVVRIGGSGEGLCCVGGRVPVGKGDACQVKVDDRSVCRTPPKSCVAVAAVR
jgi:hypothetical protein